MCHVPNGNARLRPGDRPLIDLTISSDYSDYDDDAAVGDTRQHPADHADTDNVAPLPKLNSTRTLRLSGTPTPFPPA